jgi:hypothetical protein
MTTTETTETRGARTNADITALLRARHTLLWVTTREEVRVERALTEAAGAARYETMFWDCAQGITTADGTVAEMAPDPNARAAARLIVKRVEKEGETASIVLADVQRGAIAKARMAFLDLEEPAVAAAPEVALPAIQPQRFAGIDEAGAGAEAL